MSEKTERPISETGEFPGWLEEAVGLLRSSEEHDENCGIPHPADPDQSDRCTCGLASRTQRAEDLLAENFDRLLAAPDHPAPQLGERERYEPAQEVYDTAIAAFKRTREFSEEKANGAVSEETLIMVAIDNALPLIIAALANQEPQVQPDGGEREALRRILAWMKSVGYDWPTTLEPGRLYLAGCAALADHHPSKEGEADRG